MSEAKPKLPAKRPGNPNWGPGVSGNPAGRPPNSKNKLTKLKQELEIAVRDHLRAGDIIAIVDKMAKMAKGGDVKAAKLILDKVLSNASEGEQEAQTNSQFVFQVKNLTLKHDDVSKPVIDADFDIIPSPQQENQ